MHSNVYDRDYSILQTSSTVGLLHIVVEAKIRSTIYSGMLAMDARYHTVTYTTEV